MECYFSYIMLGKPAGILINIFMWCAFVVKDIFHQLHFSILYDLLCRIQTLFPHFWFYRYFVWGKIYRWVDPSVTCISICMFEELIKFWSELPTLSFRESNIESVARKFCKCLYWLQQALAWSQSCIVQMLKLMLEGTSGKILLPSKGLSWKLKLCKNHQNWDR